MVSGRLRPIAWLFDDSDESQEDDQSCRSYSIEDQLDTGQDALRMIRCKVSGSMALLGMVVGCFAQLFVLDTNIKEYEVVASLTWATLVTCIIVLALAPLEGDLRFTRFALCGMVANMMGEEILAWKSLFVSMHDAMNDVCPVNGEAHVPEQLCWVIFASDCFQALICLAFIGRLCSLICGSDSSTMQAGMWKSIRCWMWVMFASDVLDFSIFYFVFGQTFRSWEGFIVVDICALVLASSKRVQRCIHERLCRFFDAHASLAAAAGIAGLIGGFSVEEAIAEAKMRFRAIDLDKLDKDDFITSPIYESPSQAISHRARSLKLGQCDAFVSHSWHDDSNLKWEALQSWRAKFMQEKHREPAIWFDKACIDQTSIEDDLRCLPIFLSGCKQLVIFCGTTFLRRLWCIMELFTFVHMRGRARHVEVVLLTRPGFEVEDEQTLKNAFKTFDANECECFNPEDKERMLSIIQSAFGTLDRFNCAVIEVLEQVTFAYSDSDDEDKKSEVSQLLRSNSGLSG
eukprot:TRINITY_DN72387_c0_g1_i1.p1 TRINITY_DN72387_c0_g1~~TRINITY_DN72387_c0_g1_i1.p1  ORF type:complete len:529 (+),score=73.18 TRINITY_DN72387_c0_g1_i1:44-1588(+)